MKVNINLIDKATIILLVVLVIICNFFMIFDINNKYIDISKKYDFTYDIQSIEIYNYNNCVKITDKNIIDNIYNKIKNIKIRDRYVDIYLKIYKNKNIDKNRIYTLYINGNIENKLSIYNKLIIINDNYYVCDIDISKYIDNIFYLYKEANNNENIIK